MIRPEIAPGRRVIAISDIHGNLPFLKGVLAKAKFSPEDVLILVGDLSKMADMIKAVEEKRPMDKFFA